MADMEKQEILQDEVLAQEEVLTQEEGLEMQEGFTAEELDALANEFTLEDLAEFDEGFEFAAADLESLKPTYTKKEKLKMILMNNTVCSIIKWCFAGLGLIGLVLHILALVSPNISESLTTSLSAGVRGALTAVSNLLPISLMEILAVVVLVGILAYAGFLIYKTIVAKKDGVKIAGYWVQFGYALVAVFGFAYLLFVMSFGVTTNRPMLYNTYLKKVENGAFKPNYFKEEHLDGSMLFYIDQLNEVAVDGMENLYYTTSGHSRYNDAGRSLEEIAKAVNECYDLAAEDFKFLKGSEVVVKEMIATPLYTSMGIGSMFSPFTGEVLVNPEYPEVVIPMQVARAIAKQRGITNDQDASFIAFLVCTEYADQLEAKGEDYNTDYLKYSAYMDAYLEVGNIVYRINPNIHLYCGSALKETAKKDIIAFVSTLDKMYGNISKLTFENPSKDEKTSTEDYKKLAKLLYSEFMNRVDKGSIGLKYNSDDKVVPVKSSSYVYLRYLVANFTYQYNEGWGDEVQELYDEYNEEPLPNDGSVDIDYD